MILQAIKKYWCLVLAAFVFVITLTPWFEPDDIDILFTSILIYGVFFPVCGIILGIHYGRCDTAWKWILPVCAFAAVMIHDMIVGYLLFDKVEFDPGQFGMYLCTAIPCGVVEIITHFIKMRVRKRRQ